MKNCYALFLFMFLATSIASATEFYRGYLVTKSGTRLTGYVGMIQHSGDQSSVMFVNDFGTPYNIHPALVKGFVFVEEENWIAFESVHNRNKWMFLKVIYKGDRMSLYKAPEERQSLIVGLTGPTTQTFISHEYWVEVNGRQPYKLKRSNFKKRMRKLLANRYPELAEKIGQKGYRFNDLEAIVKEFDDSLIPQIFKL